jgi:hypothetical protein
MNRRDAMAWVLSVCAPCIRLSQAKTLSELVDAAMRCPRISLPNIGRASCGGVASQIKRCWRFIANQRIEPSVVMSGVIRRWLKHRAKPLWISFDWTDIRGFQTLAAAVCIRGRAVPLCWATCDKGLWKGYRSRNAFEESLLLVLRNMIPSHVPVIILADRGFGRTELARFCQRIGFHYVIRIVSKVHIRSPRWSGRLDEYPVRHGTAKLLRHVQYRQEHAVRQNVVIRWKKELSKSRDECWYLMTDLEGTPEQISNEYAHRMDIEELFRDAKNKFNGWSLRHTRITRADRLDRLLLILALAYILLCGLGLLARSRCRPSCWTASSKNDCSIFTIGRIMLDRLRCTAEEAFHQLIDACFDAVPRFTTFTPEVPS